MPVSIAEITSRMIQQRSRIQKRNSRLFIYNTCLFMLHHKLQCVCICDLKYKITKFGFSLYLQKNT